MGLIIAVGLIFSVLYSKNKVQGKASVWAFVSLAIVFALFCAVVVFGSQRWTLPVFIIACTVVPIGVYVLLASREQKEAEVSRAKRNTNDTAYAKSGKGKEVRIPKGVIPIIPTTGSGMPIYNDVKSATGPAEKAGASNHEAVSAWVDGRKDALGKDADAGRKAAGAKDALSVASNGRQGAVSVSKSADAPVSREAAAKPEPKPAPMPEQASEPAPKPAPAAKPAPSSASGSESLPEKAPEQKAAPVSVPMAAKPVPEPAADPAVELEPAVEPEPVVDESSLEHAAALGSEGEAPIEAEIQEQEKDSAEPDAEEPTTPEPETAAEPEPTPEPAPDLQAEVASVPVQPESEASTEITYESCLEKASVFKNKGLEGIAAGLYKQASQLASDEKASRSAMMLAMGCYVNADLPNEAYIIAQELSEKSDSLSAVQRLKIDAVMRLV